jgi:hypothetical protein
MIPNKFENLKTEPNKMRKTIRISKLEHHPTLKKLSKLTTVHPKIVKKTCLGNINCRADKA